jgi:hypothetical protein
MLTFFPLVDSQPQHVNYSFPIPYFFTKIASTSLELVPILDTMVYVGAFLHITIFLINLFYILFH